jgi:NAD(P)-dependent dehydrogenase (short-subunit alcohol dehydrogenase family)
MTNQKVAIVTGGNSGIGRAKLLLLQERELKL